MKKIITLLCLLLLSLNGHGQGTGVEIPVMSPETASLGKFGAYPVSYYTGQPDISIPLYRLDVHGLSIPIALRYDPSGFMPNKDSGKVGHDWSLVAGGIITRSVNLMPDEYSGNSFNSYNAANKLLSEVRTTNSDGTVHRTTYNYPTDYPSDGVCAAMTQKFMVSPVIYERSYAGDLLLKTRHTRYALFCNKFYAPGLVEESRGSGAFHTLVEYHAYDRFGNLLSFTENGRPTEVWLWGYHSLFPIARLVGTTLNAVYGVVPSYTIDALSALTDPGALGNTTLGTLASNIPTAQVTTYKHRPLVGLVHTGHPNGLAQDYTYDAFGRLRSVSTDGDKRQEYTYHHTHVSASPLSAVFGDTSPSYKQGEHSFSMQVSGGSGVYGHNWCLTASDGTVVASSNDLTLVHTFNQSGSYTLACTVTDLVTREQVTKQRTFTIGLYRIAFSEITETSSPSTGDVTVTAAIYCNVPTTVSFRLDYRVGATLPETHYECRIGNYFESNSGRGEKEFTVSLPAGKTNVSLSLRNIIVAAEMELFIESVTGDNNEIGYPSSLAIYF